MWITTRANNEKFGIRNAEFGMIGGAGALGVVREKDKKSCFLRGGSFLLIPR